MRPPIRLKARLDGIGQRLLASEPALLRRVTEVHGSPCHLVFPGEFMTRVNEFKHVFADTGVRGRIFYASKANKSEAFLETAAQCGIGVDVASREEMTAALAAGLHGERLMVTGPDKGASLHRLAIRQGACMALDSVEELASLIRTLTESDGTRARVVLRFRPAAERTSRFGLSQAEIMTALDMLTGETSRIDLEGFSVHLGGYDIQARVHAGSRLVAFVLAARAMGLAPWMIDLGGGWPVRYVGQQDWMDFVRNASPADFHAERQFGGFYPYYHARAGHEALRACLLSSVEQGGTLAALCALHGVTIAVEPGRALLDQAGLSIFRIKSVRARDDGYAIVTAEGQSFSLSEQWFGSEFLPDPILIPDQPRLASASRACVAGSSCLDTDMLTWRKIEFPATPVAGDLLIYANTAGYQMDSNESPFHRVPLPRKIAVWADAQRIRWCDDGLFHHADPATFTADILRNPHDDYFPHHRLDRLHASA